jgi:hypothetical protein
MMKLRHSLGDKLKKLLEEQKLQVKEPPPAPEPPRKKRRYVVGAVLLVLLLAGCGACGTDEPTVEDLPDCSALGAPADVPCDQKTGVCTWEGQECTVNGFVKPPQRADAGIIWYPPNPDAAPDKEAIAGDAGCPVLVSCVNVLQCPEADITCDPTNTYKCFCSSQNRECTRSY